MTQNGAEVCRNIHDSPRQIVVYTIFTNAALTVEDPDIAREYLKKKEKLFSRVSDDIKKEDWRDLQLPLKS